MKIEIHHRCANFNSYRAARVKSLFNVESGADFRLSAELPLHERPWQIGVVVGPSGSGKTSIGKSIGQAYAPKWPANRPLVDAIAADGDFDAVTAALSSVGLGDVPAWLAHRCSRTGVSPSLLLDEIFLIVCFQTAFSGRSYCIKPAADR